jgi:SAM-dependent methyltransferase
VSPRPRPDRTDDSADFARRQWAYFRDADEAKFLWQTTAPVFAATERELVAAARGDGRLLEVGCGEGGNLFHLGPRSGLSVGLDSSMAKATFASGAIAWGRFVGGDALLLPFRSGAFDRVLCRDVLHHLPEGTQRAAVAELFRICRPGGEVVVIEPNGRNPLIGVFALLFAAERGMLRSTPVRMEAMVRSVERCSRMEMAQPLPLARILLHYRMGWPELGRRRLAARLLALTDAALRRLLPRAIWAYIIVRGASPARRPRRDEEMGRIPGSSAAGDKVGGGGSDFLTTPGR